MGTQVLVESIVTFALVAGWAVLWWRNNAWLADWAAGHRFELLRVRRVLLSDLRWQFRVALASWPLRAGCAVYHVEVRDRRGEVRTGKVLLARSVLWLRDHVETRWDDELAEVDPARRAIRRYREMKTREHANG